MSDIAVSSCAISAVIARVGFTLGYSHDALLDHPHLLQFREFSSSDLPCAPRVESQEDAFRISHLLGEEIEATLGLCIAGHLLVARLVLGLGVGVGCIVRGRVVR